MIIGVPKETLPGERRVALTPAMVHKLEQNGTDVLVEAGAGAEAGWNDGVYKEMGAEIVKDRDALFERADLVLQVNGPGSNPDHGHEDVARMHEDQVILGLQNPLGAPHAAADLAKAGVTTFSMELVPRISRAQSMDVLSSMATVAGYKAVILAAETLPRMFPQYMTAAGTITPAKVFVIGAGVAGLQAIATARRLGAVVQAYDIRPVVKEQVESLGARFVMLDLETEGAEGSGGYAKAMTEEFYEKQRQKMLEVVSGSDVVVTTAAVPGRAAPVLVTEEAVRAMHPGSVIVDLAAPTGGNCELTRVDETVETDGVTILGPSNLPSTIPYHASQLLAKNLTNFLDLLLADGELDLDRDDPVIQDTLLTRNGEVVNDRVRSLLEEG